MFEPLSASIDASLKAKTSIKGLVKALVVNMVDAFSLERFKSQPYVPEPRDGENVDSNEPQERIVYSSEEIERQEQLDINAQNESIEDSLRPSLYELLSEPDDDQDRVHCALSLDNWDHVTSGPDDRY